MLKSTRQPDGTYQHRRPVYAAKDYTVPGRVLDEITNLGCSYADAWSPPDGYFTNSCVERERFTRDGAQWVVIWARVREFAVEVQLDALGDVVQVVPVEPERAYAMARAADGPQIIQEG
jgi:hypothetical protein